MHLTEREKIFANLIRVNKQLNFYMTKNWNRNVSKQDIQMFYKHRKGCPTLSVIAAAAAAAAKSLQLCRTLCYPVDSSPPGSAVPGILQTRTLEWVAISFSNAWKWKVKVKSLSRSVAQGCLSNPRDCSPPGSSVHGIFQARVLEWGVIAFSVSVIREMQIKTTIRYYFTSIRMAIIIKTNIYKCWWGCGETGTLIECC